MPPLHLHLFIRARHIVIRLLRRTNAGVRSRRVWRRKHECGPRTSKRASSKVSVCPETPTDSQSSHEQDSTEAARRSAPCAIRFRDGSLDASEVRSASVRLHTATTNPQCTTRRASHSTTRQSPFAAWNQGLSEPGERRTEAAR